MALLMSRERPEALPGLNRPQFQGLVAGAYKVAGVVRVELDIKNYAPVSLYWAGRIGRDSTLTVNQKKFAGASFVFLAVTELLELCPARHIP